MADFDTSVEKTLKFEGGYVNDPNDAGGETNFGISKRYHPNVDIKSLTKDDAEAIYQDEYWDAIDGDSIPSQAAADSVFDMAVNAGVKRALALAKSVCDSLNIQSLNNVDDQTGPAFAHAYGLARISYYKDLAAKKPQDQAFLQGWIDRANSFFRWGPEKALMLGGGAVLFFFGLWYLQHRKHSIG
jgi:lysozyme family protein